MFTLPDNIYSSSTGQILVILCLFFKIYIIRRAFVKFNSFLPNMFHFTQLAGTKKQIRAKQTGLIFPKEKLKKGRKGS